MQDENKFSEWYRQRFNAIVEQPPDEVWNNISKELDIKEVWSRVDSRLTRINRRKIFVRRTAYASILLLLFFVSGSVIFKTYKNTGGKIGVDDKKNNRLIANIHSSGYDETPQTKKEVKFFSNHYDGEMDNSKSTNVKSPVISFFKPREDVTAMQHEKKINVSDNSISTHNPENISNINADHKNKEEEFFTVPISTVLVANNSHNFPAPDFSAIVFHTDSNYYYQTPDKNKFHGFYSGRTGALNNIWLLNQITLSGLKANSLNQIKIDFGYSYGILAGYNFNNHFGGEMSWYVHSQSGQTYSSYDEGKYETKQIRKDISVLNLIFKYRNQAYNIWLNTPKSQNILLGINLSILKRDRSVMPPNDNDDDTDIYENINTHYGHVSYGVVVGYEYEILAFHKIILSSALIGNLGLNNIFLGNEHVPESFNRTHTASLGFNIAAKYLLK